MRTAVRTDLVLRLHTDKTGLVWYGDHEQLATNTCLDAWDFFENEGFLEELDNARAVRLLGIRANAPLVVKLQERRAGNPEFAKKVIWLVSPASVPGCWLKDDPASVLQHLWQPSYGASLLGCWHEMTTADYSTYAIINTLGDKPGREVPEVTRRIAEYHPAWDAITFIRGVDRDAACKLLADVVDPRWYRHPSRPDRLSRLHVHLGLTPENMAACTGEGRSGHHFNRATNAVKVWYNLSARRDTRVPGDFLGRVLDDHGADLAKGLLRGTQRLVEFIAAVWLDAVSPHHPEAGFDPAQFFRDPAVAKAFVRHRAACKGV